MRNPSVLVRAHQEQKQEDGVGGVSSLHRPVDYQDSVMLGQ
jgi:hypothetical protein